MNKFLKNIKYTIVNLAVPKEIELNDFNINVDIENLPQIYNTTLGVGISLNIKVDKYYTIFEQMDNDVINPFEETKRDFLKQVTEEIFGEFRPLIYKIIDSAYKRDFQKVVENAKELEKSMFDVDDQKEE